MPFPKEQNHCLFFHRGGQYLWLLSTETGSNIPRLLGSAASQQHTGRSTNSFPTQGQGWCWKCSLSTLLGTTFHPCISKRAGPRQSLTVLQRLVNVHHLCWIVPARAPLNVLEKQLLLKALKTVQDLWREFVEANLLLLILLLFLLLL